MKKLGVITLVFLLQSSLSFGADNLSWGQQLEALGGVGIGNGGRVFAGMIEGHYANEDLLLKKVNETIHMIRRGNHPRVQQWIHQGSVQSI